MVWMVLMVLEWVVVCQEWRRRKDLGLEGVGTVAYVEW